MDEHNLIDALKTFAGASLPGEVSWTPGSGASFFYEEDGAKYAVVVVQVTEE